MRTPKHHGVTERNANLFRAYRKNELRITLILLFYYYYYYYYYYCYMVCLFFILAFFRFLLQFL